MTHRNGSIIPVACFGGQLTVEDGVYVEIVSSGRAYIALGQPGFNSPANNRGGYSSEKAARAASKRYAKGGR